MRKTAPAITADEYIRRIDRMLLITSTVVIILTAGFLGRMI